MFYFRMWNKTRMLCFPLLFALFIEPLSQYIRQNIDIKGIDMPTGEHKLVLFTDDVLIYLVQHTHPLPKLMNILNKYESLSGYKLNIHKTQIIFNYDPPKHIRSRYKLKRDTDIWVSLPKDLSKIQLDLSRWNVIQFLNVCAGVESIRINILPRLLYIFQTLPINIPPKHL